MYMYNCFFMKMLFLWFVWRFWGIIIVLKLIILKMDNFLIFYIISFLGFFYNIDNCFLNKNGIFKNDYFVIGNLKKYFVENILIVFISIFKLLEI